MELPTPAGVGALLPADGIFSRVSRLHPAIPIALTQISANNLLAYVFTPTAPFAFTLHACCSAQSGRRAQRSRIIG